MVGFIVTVRHCTMPANAPPLSELLASTQHLLDRFSTSLSSDVPTTSSSTSHTAQPDPFAILNDAAKLLKAHATKLGLLLLNKPFTPSAVAGILSEISGTCIPAMMGAVEILGSRYGTTVGAEVRSAVRQLVMAVIELSKDIGTVSKSPEKQDLKQQSDSTLASTGQVWSACDELMKLATLGAVGIICRKAEEHRQLLRDAIEELKEYSEEADEGYSDDEVTDQDSDVQFGPSKIPADRPELRTQVQTSVKKLGLLDVAMKAVAKRRLKSFPFGTSGEQARNETVGSKQDPVEQLNTVMDCLKQLPEQVDELAGKFYEFDEAGAEKQLQFCCATLTKAMDLVKDGWANSANDTGENAAFADWVVKWKGLLQP